MLEGWSAGELKRRQSFVTEFLQNDQTKKYGLATLGTPKLKWQQFPKRHDESLSDLARDLLNSGKIGVWYETEKEVIK
jgi:hypothetical protein